MRAQSIGKSVTNRLKILAVDPAEKTGWAHSDGDSGVWNFKTKPDESSALKYLKLQKSLTDIYLERGIDLLAYEAPRGWGHHRALVSHSEYTGVIKAFCAYHHLEYKGYTATQIKIHATGYGRASKSDMVSRAKFKWGEELIIDDNHADAMWLLDLTRKEFNDGSVRSGGD